ncbi:MAG: DUF814 domain-containing protein [Cyclobacteriaceae bacterium]
MHFNYYFLKALVKALEPKLIGSAVTSCFSQNKDELVLIFESENDQFIIKSSFDGQANMMTFPSEYHRAKKNSVDLFQELIDLEVEGITLFENERSFTLDLSHQNRLLFKLHGRQANICLFQKGTFHSMFKHNYSKDKVIILDELHRNIDQSDRAIRSSDFDLNSTFPTFDKHIKSWLKHEKIETVDEQQRLAILKRLLNELQSGKFYILEEDFGRPFLSLIPLSGYNQIYDTNDPIDVCNQLSRVYHQKYLLSKEKDVMLQKVVQEKTKAENYVRKSNKKLDGLKNSIKYSEQADILMANLHLAILPDQKSVEVFDFYRNQNITIKIKQGKSLQANAEILYRKAKNQKIEIEKIEENIASKESQLLELIKRKNSIAVVDNFKELRKISKNNSNDQKVRNDAITRPYFEYDVDGVSVLVGKNAKSNDKLLQSFTSKEDTWLHARNVSGSHVIAKTQGKIQLKETTLEKIAQIAAWYSKGKNDTLCPVIYTKRKYVSKIRGGAPGQVAVQREQVILVNPCQNPQ